MMSVFDGGDGCDSAGRSVRSSERFGEWRRVEDDDDPEDERDLGGVDTTVAIVCEMLTNMIISADILRGRG